jgi:hypothetical protein
MKRVMAYVWAMLVVAALSLTQFASAGGGGGGGNKRCVDHKHSIDPWTITCRPQDNCAGGCYKLDWLSRDCIQGNEKCDPTTLTVPRVMKRAPCLRVPNDPTCGCSGQYTAIGVWDEVVVSWCNP